MTSRHARGGDRRPLPQADAGWAAVPTMRICCGRAGWSRSTGHRAFGSVAALHRAAFDDVAAAAELRLALEILDGQGQTGERQGGMR
jgi:hypothetical protein